MRLPVSALLPVLLLTGCSLAPTALPTQEQGVAITGRVHGGQQPIVGAHVYLFAANTTGYGGNNIAPSSSNASLSLLNAVATGHSDSIGAYVLTAADGSFTITGDYACTSGQQVYLYALGGNPGAGTNSASGLLAILGNCPAAGNFAAPVPTIWVNEVSTIAAAYSFAGFASDATHVSSSGTALAKTGIANAFANAGNLVTLSAGTALATTPNGNGNVPQQEINTLANILASCVNSASSASSACTTLFANAKSAGSTGTTATDTATAAINIAHYPGTNVHALYTIPPPTRAFGNALTAQPNDFTISLEYFGTCLSNGINFGTLAIDSGGNVWIPVFLANGLTAFNPLGVPFSDTCFTGAGLSEPRAVAVDKPGNIWIENKFTNTLSKYNSSGAAQVSFGPGASVSAGNALAVDGAGTIWVTGVNGIGAVTKFGFAAPNSPPYTGGGYVSNDAFAAAIDGAGNFWTESTSNNLLVKFNSAGTPLSGSGFTGGGLNAPFGMAIDSGGNVWVANSGANTISKFNQSGSPIVANGYSGGGLANPAALAIDGAGNIFVANQSANGISEFNSAGVPLSPSTTYLPEFDTAGPNTIAVDGSGNVWTGNYSFDTLTVFIGLATPVITPIAAGLPSTFTADGSSNLGTRP